jgi:hypothetical protein
MLSCSHLMCWYSFTALQILARAYHAAAVSPAVADTYNVSAAAATSANATQVRAYTELAHYATSRA